MASSKIDEKCRTAMDLLFDARHVHASGIGTYIQRILADLPGWSAKTNLSVAVLASSDCRNTDLQMIRSSRGRMYSAAEQFALYRAIRTQRPRLFWTPHYVPPLLSTVPYCVTVHDLIHLHSEDEGGLTWPKQILARALVGTSIKGAELVFTDTQTVQVAVQARQGTANERVKVAPFGIDPVWFEAAAPPNTPTPYFIYVGNVKRHKNLTRLLEAFDMVHQYRPDVALYLVGGGSALRTTDSGVRKGLSDSKVRMVGRLAQPELIRMVAGATALVLPSLSEGMGIPPLEAMAVGTASLVSNIPVLRETCGTGSLYCDPRSVEDIAQKMLQLLLDEGLRNRVVMAGRDWVRQRQQLVTTNRALAAIEDWFRTAGRQRT